MSALNKNQAIIHELCEQGLTPLAIATKLGMLERAVKAQMTRIQTKLRENVRDQDRQERRSQRTARKTETVPTSDTNPADVVRQAAQSGTASYEEATVPPALREIGERAAKGRDIHPMVLLGVTIQYVKLIGSRMAAHQMIEDVYDALRTMVGDGEPPKEGSTSPWPRNLEVENAELKQRAIALEQELSDLRRAVAG